MRRSVTTRRARLGRATTFWLLIFESSEDDIGQAWGYFGWPIRALYATLVVLKAIVWRLPHDETRV